MAPQHRETKHTKACQPCRVAKVKCNLHVGNSPTRGTVYACTRCERSHRDCYTQESKQGGAYLNGEKLGYVRDETRVNYPRRRNRQHNNAPNGPAPPIYNYPVEPIRQSTPTARLRRHSPPSVATPDGFIDPANPILDGQPMQRFASLPVMTEDPDMFLGPPKPSLNAPAMVRAFTFPTDHRLVNQAPVQSTVVAWSPAPHHNLQYSFSEYHDPHNMCSCDRHATQDSHVPVLQHGVYSAGRSDALAGNFETPMEQQAMDQLFGDDDLRSPTVQQNYDYSLLPKAVENAEVGPQFEPFDFGEASAEIVGNAVVAPQLERLSFGEVQIETVENSEVTPQMAHFESGEDPTETVGNAEVVPQTEPFDFSQFLNEDWLLDEVGLADKDYELPSMEDVWNSLLYGQNGHFWKDG